MYRYLVSLLLQQSPLFRRVRCLRVNALLIVPSYLICNHSADITQNTEHRQYCIAELIAAGSVSYSTHERADEHASKAVGRNIDGVYGLVGIAVGHVDSIWQGAVYI